MRNGLIGIVGISVLASMMASVGCSSNTTTNNGGTGNTGNATGATGNGGGSSAGGGNPGSGGSTPADTRSCTSVTPCGGDIVGTWNVTASCMKLSGTYDVSLVGLGCPSVPISGSLQTTGTFTVDANHNYTDNTKTTGTAAFPLAANCLSISSVATPCERMANIFSAMGWASATCTNTNNQCNCTVTADMSGGLGFISSIAATSGAYATSGSTLTLDDSLKYSYCVSGSNNTLTVTPQMSALSGTITLVRQGTPSGTGGATSTGGAPNTGMGGQIGNTGGSTTAGTGGSTGVGVGGAFTGGITGAGGAPTGGKSGVGGAATGGSGPKGGTTSTGGSSGSVTGGVTATGGATTTGTGVKGPCDIYNASGVKCVAAHSTTRQLLSTYTGPLYQVKRASDNTMKDIPIGAGGYADSAVQDTFCTGTTCTIWRVYDQSGNGNFVEAETPDSTVGGHSGMTAAKATTESLTLNGHKVYSLYTNTSQAYWRDGSKSGMPLGSQPEGIYMVTSGKHYNSGCCYDYGNGETTRTYVAGPSMDSVYFGSCTIWGTGAGNGPWIMADMEDGMTAGTPGKNNNNPTQTATYVTAIEKNNGTTEWALRGGDATVTTLPTIYKGALPAGKNPMKKQGSIVVGSGGDCCYSNNTASAGTFYEGAIVAGYPSDATENEVQANIAAAGYGK